MDYTLLGLENLYCFLNDILIVFKRSEEDHNQYVVNCLKRLDEENFRIRLTKCRFANLKIAWLGCDISKSEISSIESNAFVILSLEAAKTLKKTLFSSWISTSHQ